VVDFDIRLRITRVLAADELGSQIEPKMRNLGNAIGARAQRLVPKRTFALHDSIRSETSRAGATVTTTVSAGGGDVDYALFVERGTSRMGAQPYLRPAFLQSKASDLEASAIIQTRGISRPARRGRR
jgi:HK97 gp10 family phage protein